MINQIVLLVIGAAISLITTIVVATITGIAKYIYNNLGEINIYKKIVYMKDGSGETWGVFTNSGRTRLQVPLWVEIHNSKNTFEIIRNLHLKLYKNNKFICCMKQQNYMEKGSGMIRFGNNGSYSFMLEPNSIRLYQLLYILYREESIEEFDEIRISYKNKNDKLKEFSLIKDIDGWSEDQKTSDEDWAMIS